MAQFTWYLQGSTDTVIEDTDTLEFAGGTFSSPVITGQYQSSMHVRSSGGADDSSGNSPNNVKFVSQDGGTNGHSQADWGDGVEDLDQIQASECTLKINFSHDVAVATSDAIFYAYDGSTVTNPPVEVTFQAAEFGNTNWTNAEGSGSALQLADQVASTSHDFYIAVSASPDTASAKNFKIRMELTYA